MDLTINDPTMRTMYDISLTLLGGVGGGWIVANSSESQSFLAGGTIAAVVILIAVAMLIRVISD